MLCGYAAAERWEEPFYGMEKMRNKEEKHMLSSSQKATAIAWAANKEKASYGSFSATLTYEKTQQLYTEYEAYLNEKQRAEKKMLAEQRKRAKAMKDLKAGTLTLPECTEDA